jgi:Flp pilus assembly protein TadG
MRRGERAQALYEFALVLPLFLLLMFGLIDFSRMLFSYVSIANGARELARSASVSTGFSSSRAVAAFNNATIIAGLQNPLTDSVTIRVVNASCARILDTGIGGPCSSTPALSSPRSVVCSLPLQSTCAVPQPSQGGFVEVQATYTFQYNPLFQTRLDNVLEVSFMRPTSVLTTTARVYVE